MRLPKAALAKLALLLGLGSDCGKAYCTARFFTKMPVARNNITTDTHPCH